MGAKPYGATMPHRNTAKRTFVIRTWGNGRRSSKNDLSDLLEDIEAMGPEHDGDRLQYLADIKVHEDEHRSVLPAGQQALTLCEMAKLKAALTVRMPVSMRRRRLIDALTNETITLHVAATGAQHCASQRSRRARGDCFARSLQAQAPPCRARDTCRRRRPSAQEGRRLRCPPLRCRPPAMSAHRRRGATRPWHASSEQGGGSSDTLSDESYV